MAIYRSKNSPSAVFKVIQTCYIMGAETGGLILTSVTDAENIWFVVTKDDFEKSFEEVSHD